LINFIGKMLRRAFPVLQRCVSNVVRKQYAIVPAVQSAVPRRWGHGVSEPDDVFDARWEAYFNRPNIDEWELRKGLNDLYAHDLVPEPKIVIAALKACRRLDDLAMTVRLLEMIKDKSGGNQEIYNYIVEQCKPTLEELGISTPEELGLN